MPALESRLWTLSKAVVIRAERPPLGAGALGVLEEGSWESSRRAQSITIRMLFLEEEGVSTDGCGLELPLNRSGW